MTNQHRQFDPTPEPEPSRPLRPETPPYGSEPSAPLVPPDVAWPDVDRVIDALADGVYVAAPDGRILRSNRALTQLLGGIQAPLTSEVLLQALPTDAQLRQLPLPDGPLWIRTLDGRDVLTRHSTIDNHGLPAGYLVGILGQTGADRMSALGLGAMGILHDISNVLMGISGYSELLNARADSEDADRLQRLRDLAVFGSAIAEQFVRFASPPAGARRSCQVNRVVIETVRAFQSRVPDTVAVEFEMDESIRPVWVDATQVGQLVLNLLLNAVSAIGGHVGTVTFRTSQREAAPRIPHTSRLERRPRGSYVVLEVSDTGRGMAEAQMKRVFEPFVTMTGGSGIGLAVVREVLLRSGGGIEIDSRVGSGTTFRLFLPLRP